MAGPTDISALHPSEGARFLFERVSESQDLASAAYRAVIFTPGERYRYRVELDIDGHCARAAEDAPAPPELEKMLDTMTRLMARSARTKRAESLPPWPHRVLRWRGPGRG